MTWFLLALGSYFLTAFSTTIDKVLLKERVPQPAVYAFYSGLLSAGILLFLPFYALGLWFMYGTVLSLPAFILPPRTLLLALSAGVFFVPALYFLYVSLKRCDVSRIIPMIGGATPIFIIIFSYIFLGSAITALELLGVCFFIAGGFILATEVMCESCVDSLGTHLLGIKGHRLQVCGVETGKGLGAALLAACFFALTYFISDIALAMPTPFIVGFTWMRLGSSVGAIGMLSIPSVYKDVRSHTQNISRGSSGLLVGNKIIGASAFILFNAAIYRGPVIIISALKGFEYLFVFTFSMVLTVVSPQTLEEPFDKHTIILKLVAVSLISFGFLFLVYS